MMLTSLLSYRPFFDGILPVVSGVSMNNPKKKVRPVNSELPLPEGMKVLGFTKEEIPHLTGEDVALACIKAQRSITRYEMLLLMRLGYDPESVKRPKRSAEELIRRFHEIQIPDCKY